MHIIFLKFGPNKAQASTYMEAHNAWITKGMNEGIFQCVGSLGVGGGFILAHGESDADIKSRVDLDPFVEHGIVTVEINQVNPKRAVPQLEYLIDDS